MTDNVFAIRRAQPMALRRVLVVCGVANEQREIVEALTGAGYAVTVANNRADMLRNLATGAWLALVADNDVIDCPLGPSARLTKSTHLTLGCQYWFGSWPAEMGEVFPPFRYVPRPLDAQRMLDDLEAMCRSAFMLGQPSNYCAGPSAEILPFID